MLRGVGWQFVIDVSTQPIGFNLQGSSTPGLVL